MKIFLTLFLLYFSNFVFGQFAIIHDSDGYCHIRSTAKIEDNIIDTLKNGHLIYSFETTGNWTNINYSKGKKEGHGLVYKDGVKLISAYQNIPVLDNNNYKIVLGKDSIRIVLTGQKFNPEKYKLSFNHLYKDQLQLINNKQYWGTDGEIPNTQYKTIEVSIGKRKILLPESSIDNLFEISLSNTMVNYDTTNDILYIQSTNSDGAGSYAVIWKVEKGVYKERYIAYGF